MLYAIVSNNQGCVLETKKVDDQSYNKAESILKDYQNPASVSVTFKTEDGQLVANYTWEDIKKSKNYRGVITDRLDLLDTRLTKWYFTYPEAHKAAEQLAKNHFTDERYEIDVEYRD
jgi:hypothetical protein